MKKSKQMLLSAMVIFGTVGIFRSGIPLEGSTIAGFRALVGLFFLLGVMLVTGRKFHWQAIRKNLWILCLSGAAMGFNWVLLFESMEHTSVAVSTVCYYLAPLFLILAAPLVGEKLTLKKLGCVAVALVGLGLVSLSGVTDEAISPAGHLKGILLALGAAVLYATVMLLSKKLSAIPAYDKTVVQFAAAAAVLIPCVFLTGGFSLAEMTPVSYLLLAVVGIVHTGIAYVLYFGAMGKLKAQTVAVFSYLDPAIAVVLSAVLLRQPMTPWSIAGTVLILGSALFSELHDHRN